MKLQYKLKRILRGKLSNFFLLVFGLIVLLSLGETLQAHNPSKLTNDKNVLKLNPAYKIKRLSTGIVIVYSNQEDGEIIRHEFENIYAEVLMGAMRKQTIYQLIPIVSRKYFFAEDESRREIKHAVHVLEDWEILISQNSALL